MSAVLLPFQTAFDPPQQAEGSLDPLGLYSIADALGVRLAPGIRERQSTPRYLTLALVGYTVCQGPLQNLASQKRVSAWLVYEWLVVQSLVKQLQGTPDLQGIPGRTKVGETLRRGEAVCASNYLKTPSVFGFHGIYRVFGVKAGLFDIDGNPLEAGRRVLQGWQKDQQLNGFLDGSGPGAELRHKIERAVRRGLESEFLDTPGSDVSTAIAKHLNPHRPGRHEREALWSTLTGSDALRGEYATRLTSTQGQVEWRAAEGQEAIYHAYLLEHASLPMRQLLLAIRAYERLARLMTDAFDETRRHSASTGPLQFGALAEQGACLRRASAECPEAFREALAQLGVVDAAARLRAERSLLWLGEPGSAADFARNLLAHHERVQRVKPPNGKRPWFDTLGDGRVAVRPAYELDQFEAREEQYVHAYRTRPIWDFALDLGHAAPEQETA